MGGILSEAERNAAIDKLRDVAERIAAFNAVGRSEHKWNRELARAWNALPELRGDPVPKAADVVALLDRMDQNNEELKKDPGSQR